MPLDGSSDELNPLDQLAEEFALRHRRGENPSLAEYTERYPQWADRIVTLFPALLLMERHKPGVDESSDSGHDDAGGPPLRQLGDYRIIREIGRGGMAIVYEAEQESLGRHVALKVMQGHCRVDPVKASRLQREARAAARLHHSNIVPVYGVGEDGGIHYYVMQFIPGQALDEVLRELRRLRRRESSGSSEAAPAQPGASRHLAEGLLSGQFAASSFDQLEPEALRTLPEFGNPQDRKDAGISATDPASLTQRSSLHLTGDAHSTSLSGQSRLYWRGVARVGVQVADALQYAHAQGVLHRDIKPSNLLLDLHGTIWVADFGLAKLADQSDLTRSGDVVGTWRYMAPERFRGQSDARSDVYSLGLTLYELLVLRPAFDRSSREELLHQVANGVPPRPRKLDPDVPRDLETIVLKAIERDPVLRYQSAGELADDLRRYLEDRPIRARRFGLVERSWRWARRNPTIASLALSVVLLLVMLAIGSSLAALSLNGERNRALANLWSANLAQARARRASHQAGQRFTSLQVLASAAKFRVNKELRNEAVACLALVDLRPVRRLRTTAGHEDVGFTVDAAGERFAVGDVNGVVRVCRLVDGRELLRLPAGTGPSRRLDFSPDGRYLSAAYAIGRGSWCYDLWDLAHAGGPRKVLALGDAFIYFSPDSQFVAVRSSPTTIDLHNAETGERRRRFTVAPISDLTGFHPDGRHLMLRDDSKRALRLLDLECGKETWTHTFDTELDSLTWRGDGRLFAVGGSDHRIYVWDTEADRLQSVLEGHQNTVVELQFTHAGDLLISSSWDGSTRVWDPVRGTNLVTTPGGLIRIGADDRRLLMREDTEWFSFWELADGRECRTLHHGMVGNRTPRPRTWGPHSLDFSSDGRLLASSSIDGVRLWDPATGRAVAHLELGDSEALEFSADGSWLLTALKRGARLWPLSPIREASGDRIRVGPPRLLNPTRGLFLNHDAFDHSGRFVAVVSSDRNAAVVLDRARSAETIRLGPHIGINQSTFSPDARWVATATWKGHDVNVWDVATGRLAWHLPSDSAFVKFSPDSRWLAVSKFPGVECRLYRTGSWQPGPTIRVGRPFLVFSFSPDGRIMAVDDAGRVRLIETESGREIVTLDSGTGSTANFFCLAFSRDGGYLAAGRDHMIHLWDLRLIREQLASLGLDWSAPPLPPKTQRPTFASVELVDDDNPRLPGERDGAPERTSPKQPVNDKNSPCDP